VLVRVVTGVLEPVELAYVDRNLSGLKRLSYHLLPITFWGCIFKLLPLLFQCCKLYLLSAQKVSSAVLMQQAMKQLGSRGRCAHFITLVKDVVSGQLDASATLAEGERATGISEYLAGSNLSTVANRNFFTFTNIYLLQLSCHLVAVVILHVYKIRNWLLLNLSPQGYTRSI